MKNTRFIIFTILAVGEIVTLGILLENLVFGHVAAVAQLIGPIHGGIYLVVALTALLSPELPWSARLLGFIPVVGGVLAVVRVRRARRSGAVDPSRSENLKRT
jgi:hypothetical protein